MKINFIVLILFVSTISFSQNKCSSLTKFDLDLIAKQNVNKSIDYLEDLKRNYPIFSFGTANYVSILAKVNTKFSVKNANDLGIIVGSKIKDIVTIKVPIENLNQLINLEGLVYFEIASKIKANLDQAIKDVRADSVQKGLNLPQAYTGKNVYIGITDWGFDYTHPNFYDTLLQETRIAAAWDQYKQSGPHPEGFSYGTEYKTVNELLTAQSDTANIYSYAYHGSHVAGIAGGSGAGTAYRGVAFEAKFLMATFLIDAASVIDAYEWMYQKALQDQKRLVINQSWGLHHIGNLDGTSLLSQAIDYFSQLGVVFVSSGGNNGDVLFHIKKTFSNDTLATRVNFYTYTFPTMWGQSISYWGEENKTFSTKLKVLNVSNTVVAETPYYSTNSTSNYLDSMLIIGADTVFFNLTTENQNPLNNRPHMRLRVKNTISSLKVVLEVTATDGTVHLWNVVELTNEVGNWGMPFSKINSTYTQGDNLYGISEPACTKSTIAVAAYATNANLAGFSSRGPTLDERIKPDIAAPGVNIASSISSFTDGSFGTLTTVDFNGRTYPFSRLSGTSMSGPMVAGIVALLLEVNPYLSATQIKEIIKTTAREDDYTSVLPAEGSTEWGAGKINAYAAVKLALETIGDVDINEVTKETNLFYPNPTKELLNFTNGITAKKATIISANGTMSEVNLNENKLNLSNLPAGTYIIRLIENGKVVQNKFVKL